uniref:Fatty-acid and retinol-binding protein 1 n=1 Tax=Steinernema glaseri TaxID=37863 RepID=A0A1I7YMB2_9BILA
MSNTLLVVLLILSVAFPVRSARDAIMERELANFEKILSATDNEKLGKLESDDNVSYNEAFRKIFEVVKSKDALIKEKFAQIQETIEKEKAQKEMELAEMVENLKPLLSEKGKKSFDEMIKVFHNRDLRPSDIRLQLEGLFDSLEAKDKTVLTAFVKQNLLRS